MVCGRRWGKTALSLMSAVMGHGPRRGHRRGAIDGGQVWWIAPTYPVAAEIWRDLKRATQRAWADKDEQGRRVELPGGGSVTVKSGDDPDRLVGVGLDGVVIDEAGKVKPGVWYESIRPTLSDKGGWAEFIGTPKGFNWFHDLYQHAGRTPDWAHWQRPTADNALVPAAEIEAARLDSPRFFGQEFLARFEAQEGAEWPPEYFPESIWFSGWPAPLRGTALALDPAQGKGEHGKGCYASFALAGVDDRGVVWLECWASRDWDARQLGQRMAGLVFDRRPDACSTELNGGQEFLVPTLLAAARERKVTLPLYGFNNSVDKEVRIRRLGPLLAQGKLRVRDTPGGRLLVQQLRDFPVGEFKDCPDAAEMAVRLLIHLRAPAAAGAPTLLKG